MMKKYILALAIYGILQTVNVFADNSDNFFDALSDGNTTLSLRYRYELVDQDGFNKNAHASTLRTRLNYKTKDYKGIKFFVEADNVMEVFGDNYNAGAGNSPGNTRYPVVADPQGTEINQAWFSYAFNQDNNIKLGRQRIILDNQRFVGGVSWRQNEQTFDAISGSFDISGSKLFVSYVDKVNRIFGSDVPAGNHDNSSFLANWSNKFNDMGKLTVYYYDINNKDAKGFSTSTFGAKFSGNLNLFNYSFEYARQNDAHNNPVDYSANYYRFDGGYKLNDAIIYTGYEVLEGDRNNANSAFRTPLATLHAFNGWADKFLATPM